LIGAFQDEGNFLAEVDPHHVNLPGVLKMPYRLNLTGLPGSQRWRKRYAGRTFYLRTKGNGKTKRKSYLAALIEWERPKAHIDGLAPNPYTPTGVLMPDSVCTPAVDALPIQSRISAPRSGPVRSIRREATTVDTWNRLRADALSRSRH
jgi:hypothetical protein